jgi:hypothetical protein
MTGPPGSRGTAGLAARPGTAAQTWYRLRRSACPRPACTRLVCGRRVLRPRRAGPGGPPRVRRAARQRTPRPRTMDSHMACRMPGSRIRSGPGRARTVQGLRDQARSREADPRRGSIRRDSIRRDSIRRGRTQRGHGRARRAGATRAGRVRPACLTARTGRGPAARVLRRRVRLVRRTRRAARRFSTRAASTRRAR